MRFNYHSKVLKYYVDVTVVYPTDDLELHPGMKFQTVYLIHGGGDDDSLTYRYTNAEFFAQRNKVMLVTPNIANSFGVDTEYGVKYFSFLTEELPTVIQTLFASSGRREDNFIAGYAMGGNVALSCALKRPDLYRACVDISGGIGMTLATETLKRELVSDHFVKEFSLYTTSFPRPDKIEGSGFDLYHITKEKVESGEELCDLDVMCGSEEFIRERVEEDVRLLKEMGYPVRYHLKPGYTHDFRMFNDCVEEALDHILPLKRSVIDGE